MGRSALSPGQQECRRSSLLCRLFLGSGFCAEGSGIAALLSILYHLAQLLVFKAGEKDRVAIGDVGERLLC